jgi:hypothetical protein
MDLMVVDVSSIINLVNRTLVGMTVYIFLQFVNKKKLCFFVGKCNETPDGAFECVCELGWEGKHCEIMTNY